MSGYLYQRMSYYLCGVCLPSCMISAKYDVCIPVLYLPPVWFLFNFMMSAYLIDVCSTLWCLSACVLSVQLYDVSLSLHGVRLAVWFLPTHMMSAQLCHVCLPAWCLLNCMMSAYLCGFCSTILYDVCLPLHMMSGYLYGVCLPIWLLLTVWCLPILNVGYRIDRY
jgi:hypothetical protein